MSASKKKLTRKELESTGFVDARTQREREEQAKAHRSNVMYTVIAVVFVLVAAVVIVANSKVIERNAKAVTIGSETYTAADVDYYFYTAYNSFVSQYSSYLSLYGLDTSKSLKDQDCPVTDGGTWYDYFRDQAISSLTSYSLLAQKAEEEGFDGSEAVEESVQQTYSDLDTYAAAAGYTRGQYIKAVCGSLVNKSVFDRNVRLTALAQAYSADYANSLEYSADEVQAAYDADPKTYQSADIEYILFTASSADDATDEEKAADVEQAKQNAETALSRYAQGEAFDAIGEDMEGTYNHVAYATKGSSDMLTWAFDDARQEGDTTVAAYGETGYYAVLFHSRSRNDYHTVSVRHILVSDEDKANDILQQYLDGEQTEDAFSALAVANSTDSNASSGGLYSNIYKGQMVSEFEDWCFDPSRQAGDTGIVQTSYGYHVMYFVGASENPYWYDQAESTLKSNAYSEWYSSITDGVEAEQLDGMKYVG